MKKRIVFLVLAAVLAFSCKKDDESTTTVSLYGLDFEESPLPYIAPGVTVTLKADISGLFTSDNSSPESIGIYWSVNGGQRDTLTRDAKTSNPVFTYTTTEPGKVTVTCYAFAKDYISTSTSASYVVLDPQTSLIGLKGNTVEIGGNKFYVTDIDGVTWLASNLFGTQSGISYYLSNVTDSILGKYYTWEEALSACPEGWQLPTAQEWDALGSDACALMVDASLLDDPMWPYWPGVSITNEKGFNAIPAGYVDRAGGDDNVQGFLDYAIFWTASEADEDGMAQYRYIYSDKTEVQKGKGSKQSLALSVRCIKK